MLMHDRGQVAHDVLAQLGKGLDAKEKLEDAIEEFRSMKRFWDNLKPEEDVTHTRTYLAIKYFLDAGEEL